MAAEPEAIQFRPNEPTELVERMRKLAVERNGWINLQAVVDEDDEPVPDAPRGRAGMFAWLSSRGPSVPVCTWVPGENKRKGPEPDSLGIQHPAGPRALPRLIEAGVGLPFGWRRLADHPKRGLVVAAPAGTDPADELDWLLRASAALCTDPLPDRWIAIVHHR